MSYSLNGTQVVTFIESAVVLLALQEFTATASHRIRRVTFETHVSGKFRIPLTDVRTTINRAIKLRYIDLPSSGHIWPSALIGSEHYYLSLLAGEFKIKRSATKTTKSRRS